MQQFTRETDSLQDAALAERMLDAALRLTRLARAEVRRRGPAGLSGSQVQALSFLDWHAGASLAEVAEHLGLGAPAASRLVDELVRGGLVARESSVEDRRRVELRVRAAGRRALAAARAVARAPLAARLAALAPEAKAQLSQATEVLLGALGEPAPEGETSHG